MHVLFAYKQVDAGDGEHNDEQENGGSRCVGRITAAVSVEHVIDIADDCVHARCVQICTEKCDRIAVGFESADESGNDQIKNGGRDHRKRDAQKNSSFRGTVNPGSIVIVLIHGCKGACQKQHLEWHDNPDRIKAQYKHFGPVWSVNEINRAAAEPVDEQIDHAV